MAIYMKVDGIKGDVTTQGYENTIELISTKIVAHCETRTKTGQSHNRQVNSPHLSELFTTKLYDSSSCDIFRYMMNKTVIPTVEVFFCSLEDEQSEPYLSYRLTDVVISYYEESSHKKNALPWEEISFNYVTIEKTFNKFDSKNNFTPYRSGFDLEKAVVI